MKIGRLKDAAGTGEIVDIVYAGGTQPGTRREITVRAVEGEMLKACCLATGMPKTFRIDRLELWDGDPRVPVYDVGRARSELIRERRERRARRAANEEETVVIELRAELDADGTIAFTRSERRPAPARLGWLRRMLRW
ncbi:MAG: hypothetical protein ACK4TP_17435 [Hyphomicrobium sp.]